MNYIFRKIRFLWERVSWDNEFRMSEINRRIQKIEDILHDSRIANYLRIVDYKPGMDLKYDAEPTISLVQLQERIEAIEASPEGGSS